MEIYNNKYNQNSNNLNYMNNNNDKSEFYYIININSKSFYYSKIISYTYNDTDKLKSAK